VTYSLDSRENIKGETINLVVDPFPEVNKEKNPESKTRREKKKKKYQNKLSALIKGLNPSAYIDKSITNQFMSVGSEISTMSKHKHCTSLYKKDDSVGFSSNLYLSKHNSPPKKKPKVTKKPKLRPSLQKYKKEATKFNSPLSKFLKKHKDYRLKKSLHQRSVDIDTGYTGDSLDRSSATKPPLIDKKQYAQTLVVNRNEDPFTTARLLKEKSKKKYLNTKKTYKNSTRLSYVSYLKNNGEVKHVSLDLDKNSSIKRKIKSPKILVQSSFTKTSPNIPKAKTRQLSKSKALKKNKRVLTKNYDKTKGKLSSRRTLKANSTNGFLYNTTSVPSSAKSRNNSKCSVRYNSKIETKSKPITQTINPKYKSSRGISDQIVSPKSKTKKKGVKKRNYPGLHSNIGSNLVKHPFAMTPGIKSTLSSLNMRIPTSSSYKNINI